MFASVTFHCGEGEGTPQNCHPYPGIMSLDSGSYIIIGAVTPIPARARLERAQQMEGEFAPFARAGWERESGWRSRPARALGAAGSPRSPFPPSPGVPPIVPPRGPRVAARGTCLAARAHRTHLLPRLTLSFLNLVSPSSTLQFANSLPPPRN
jgi:hypothetical protein